MSDSRQTIFLKPWTLPVIVIAIAVPVAAGFALGGAIAGLAIGVALGAALLLITAHQKPGGPIEVATPRDRRRHVLVVASRELDDPGTIERLKRDARLAEGGERPDVRLLAPAKMHPLERWATDARRARQEAQRKLVLSAASLEKAGVSVDAAAGDEDIVRAVEDELRSFPATEVVLVTGPPDADRRGNAAARELERRLEPAVRQVTVAEAAG